MISPGLRNPLRGGYLVLLTVAVLSPALAGCGGSAQAEPTPTQSAYLAAVSVAAPDIATYRTATQLIRLGNAACDGFASGASYTEVADRLALEQGSNSLPTEDLGAVITSAADTLCAQYRYETQ